MKTWEEILNDIGLVPPEQTMQEQEALIAKIGERAFCEEYLRVARQRDPRIFSNISWQDILWRRMQLRSNRQKSLGLVPSDGADDLSPDADPANLYYRVEYRDGTNNWCSYTDDFLDDGQLVKVLVRRTGKTKIGTIVEQRYSAPSKICFSLDDMDIIQDPVHYLPAESELFYALCEQLHTGFDLLEQNHPGELPENFLSSLFHALDQFADGEDVGDFAFSAGFRSAEDSSYISVVIEKYAITVSKGGSTYDPSVGSDSYTDWTYTIWNTGTENDREIDIFCFDCIHSFLADPDVSFSIELPDEFVYSTNGEDDEADDDSD